MKKRLSFLWRSGANIAFAFAFAFAADVVLFRDVRKFETEVC